jgi:hypothetical protein
MDNFHLYKLDFEHGFVSIILTSSVTWCDARVGIFPALKNHI